MTQQPETAQSGSGEGSIPFAGLPKPPSSFGPETVVNPERRGLSPAVGPPAADSTLVNRLFPPPGDAPADQQGQGPAGVELAHFVIEGLIGRGGMGAVFRAVDKRLQRVVALKVLAPEQSRNENAVQRFLNEARASARLDHENIARVYYIGQERGLHFIAYEYVTGTNIRDLIHQTGRLDIAEAINYTLQIATALKHTWAAGIVHRDVKPSNIIVTPSGRAKLVDLGLARNEPTGSVGELTVAGTTLGTFDYISPEQAKDPRNVDVRSDIYSLGCTFYQMLTGEPPYPEGTMAAKLFKHGGNEPPDPRQKNRRVPPELAAVVQKMMASQPERRHATPEEVIRDLMVVAGRMGIATLTPQGLVWTRSLGRRQSGFWERNLSWMATALTLVVIVVLLDRFHDRIADRLTQSAQRPVGARPAGQEPTERPARTSRTGRSDPFADRQLAAQTNNGQTAAEPPIEAPNPAAENVESADTAEAIPSGRENGLQKPEQTAAEQTADNGVDEESERAVSSAPPPSRPVRYVMAAVEAPVPPRRFRTGHIPVEREPAGGVGGATDLPKIAILGNGESTGEPFETLEAACATAEDGSVIVLRYNGRRATAEKPLRIVKKRITIRAAEGYRPVITFRAGADSSGRFDSRMITLIDASLALMNVDVEMSVGSDAGTLEQWSLFHMQGAGRLELRGVQVGARVAAGSPFASVLELVWPASDELDRMNMKMTGDDAAAQKEFEVKIVESLIRAECSLFRVAHARPGRFVIEQSALALDGPLLLVLGESSATAGENADLELTTDHVTCFSRDGLIRWDSGSLPRHVLPVSVSSRNCILSTQANVPLVSMTGNTDATDFRDLLRWNGQKNFYDRFETFWSITAGFMGPSAPLVFEDWQSQVRDDVAANASRLAWRHPWWDKPVSELRIDDFALDRAAEENPAVGGASTGSDAGVDLQALARRLQLTPDGE